jgi:hypothetical protein
MRKFQETVVKIVFIFFVAGVLSGCKENVEKLPFITFEKVTEFTRDSYRTVLEYGDQYGRMSLIQFQEGDYVKSREGILYTSQGMNCYIDTLLYEVKLASTIGGSRAFSVSTYKEGGVFYYVEYQFDISGKLFLAKIIIPSTGSEEWISYKYTDDNLEINEGGIIYNVPLSTEENTGYVCNVYAFSEAPLTNKYVIHPELYFLNIYGMPIKNLPADQIVQRVGSNDNRISRVGKYYYKY